MTLGQRIAALRKEKRLSQEQLGELVGVSRQAVSKWEADKAVPDVDNCVAMSKAFGIPLARLLELKEEEEGGQESQPGAGAQDETAAGWTGLSPERCRRWSLVALVVCVILALSFAAWAAGMARTVAGLSQSVTQLQNELSNIHSNLSVLRANVAGGQRVEITQNGVDTLLSARTCEIVDFDPAAGTITYEVTVVPKAVAEGALLTFWARCGGEEVSAEAVPGTGQTWSGRLTCPLADCIQIYLFITQDDQTQTEILSEDVGVAEEFSLQFSCGPVSGRAMSLDGVKLSWGDRLPSRKMFYIDVTGRVRGARGMEPAMEFAGLWAEVRINDETVFRHDFDLAKYIRKNDGYGQYFSFGESFDGTIPELSEGDTLTITAFVEDNYGRTASALSQCYRVVEQTLQSVEIPTPAVRAEVIP